MLAETIAVPTLVNLVDRPREAARLTDGLDALTVAVFAATGVLLIARSRVSGGSRSSVWAIAYLVMAAGYPLSWAIAPIHADAAAEALDPWMQVTCFVVAIGIAFRAADRQRPPPAPVAVAVVASAVVVTVLVTLVAIHQLTQHALDIAHPAYIAVQLVLGGAWSVVAWRVLTTSRGRDDDPSTWTLALPFGVFAAAELVRTLAVTEAAPWLMATAALRMTGGFIAVTAAAVTLRQALAVEAQRRSDAERALAVTERLLSEDEMAQSRQRHDARSVVSAIHLAWTTLEKYDGQLTDETRQRLRIESIRELDRLREVIEWPQTAGARPVRLLEALAPIVASHRPVGHELRLNIDDCLVVARPADLEMVVRTLLCGPACSRRHLTRLSNRHNNSSTELVVDLDGAADAAADVPAGYSVCERLMHGMGGDINRQAPGRYLVTLQSGGSSQASNHPVEITDAADASDDHDGSRRHAAGNSPVVDDGEVDGRGVELVSDPHVDPSRTQHARKGVRQEQRFRRDDRGETPGADHTASDARETRERIRQEVETK
ncbi:MAG TPA: hypothetical protein VFH66_00830 [Mycobacteriales bacterium]|nr:hypothetical protein [Mycobacteriales bacterium]